MVPYEKVKPWKVFSQRGDWCKNLSLLTCVAVSIIHPHSCSCVQWAYLCSLGSKFWLFGLEAETESWVSGAVFCVSSSKPIMLCSSLSRAICSCCSFSSFLCCVMICCCTACLFSNLLPGDTALFERVKLLLLPRCRASWSSAAVSATCRRLTCHGWVGWATAPTRVLSWYAAEASGAKVPDLWWPSYRV